MYKIRLAGRPGLFAAFALLFVIAGVFPGISASAAQPIGIGDSFDLDPSWSWRTIETAHFRITYPRELGPVAQRSAQLFEEAHSLLSPRLLWTPALRTQILLVDNTDQANGMTSPVLRFGIILMVTPPEDWYSTGYYDDWLRLLIFHEYTHLLNMDVTTGLWSGLRYVFGDVFLPNGILPPWMLEGLAVYMETRLTHSGRGRSAYYDMVLRAAVDSGSLDTGDGVTLDRLNGTNPWYPGGETTYLYGYELTEAAAEQGAQLASNTGRTADGQSLLGGAEEALGELSRRSGGRVPFFINGNLENVFGKSWYAVWSEWLSRTRARLSADIRKIRSQPLSPVEWLTERGYEVYGSAVSPDGSLLAYAAGTLDRRMGLYLRDLKTGKVDRLVDKAYGAKIAFSADSRTLFYSALQREIYSSFYDLYAYDLSTRSEYKLTKNLRARDPAVSADGKWIAFTLTQLATTGVAVAPLLRKGDRYEIGPVENVLMPALYDRISTPVFRDADGNQVVFSMHRNGKFQQDLVLWNWRTGAQTDLVVNGRFNRQPAVDAKGTLYFVSDLTGVDNLFRYRPGAEPEQVSNLVTGLAYPSFGPAGPAGSLAGSQSRYYAAVFKDQGWNFAALDLLAPVPSSQVTVAPGPAPSPVATAEAGEAKAADYPSTEYSVFPSIWPRQWFPLLSVGPDRAIVGGEVLGSDAVGRHEYLLFLDYDTLVRRPDWLVSYVNRLFWPVITLSAENTTNGVSGTGDPLDFYRKSRFEISLSRPWVSTWWTLGTSLSFKADRNLEYLRSSTLGAQDELVSASSYYPNVDANLDFSNLESSRWSITSERGRQSSLGVRSYLGFGRPAWKAFIKDEERIPVSDHTVLVPSIRASWVNRTNPDYLFANVSLEGRTATLTRGLSGDSLDQLSIRGYPLTTFYSRGAAVASLDLKFPLLRLFRGAGTLPFFLENLSGFAFGETGYFLYGSPRERSLPSAGGGVKWTTSVFYRVPLIFTLEYDYGFRKDMHGTGEAFALVSAGALSF